jgi:hypothetical protein
VKRTHHIVLVLSGAIVSTLVPLGCSKHEPDRSALEPWPSPTALPNSDRPVDQDNNAYTPGVGYYHTPFHAWYPYPFNYYMGGHGYYYGGIFHDRAFMGPVPPRSTPDQSRWALARGIYSSRAVSQAPPDSDDERHSAAHFNGGAARGSASPASVVSSSVVRGGFGASAHGGGE